jgi:hypothetical protein
MRSNALIYEASNGHDEGEQMNPFREQMLEAKAALSSIKAGNPSPSAIRVLETFFDELEAAIPDDRAQPHISGRLYGALLASGKKA